MHCLAIEILELLFFLNELHLCIYHNLFFYSCSACDSLFPSLMALEHHKEEFEHWSGDEDICTDSEDDTSELTVASEECERLL